MSFVKGLKTIAWILVIIGGLNWGLIGVFDFNIIEKILGSMSWLVRLIYILVGLSAIWLVFNKKSGSGQMNA